MREIGLFIGNAQLLEAPIRKIEGAGKARANVGMELCHANDSSTQSTQASFTKVVETVPTTPVL